MRSIDYGWSDGAIQRELGRRLRELRLRKIVSQKDVAVAAGLARSTVEKSKRRRGKVINADCGASRALDAMLPRSDTCPLDIQTGGVAPKKGHRDETIFGVGGTDLAQGEKAIHCILNKLRNKEAVWINVGECIKAWRQRAQLQGKRIEWSIPVTVVVASHQRISREEAEAVVGKMVTDSQKKLPESISISLEKKKTRKSQRQ